MISGRFCTPESSDCLIDAGLQPVSNRYSAEPGAVIPRFPLEIRQCRRSGIIYLRQPFPKEELVPKFDWLVYMEPENHLDDLVRYVQQNFALKENAVIGGVSYKDSTTVLRFESVGYATWQLDAAQDLGIAVRGAGAESLQAAMRPEITSKLASRYPPADLLIVRHVLEHANDITQFADALKLLVAPGGKILIEIPDCSRALHKFDYTTIWEEHCYYFTENTLKVALAACGFEVHECLRYAYPFEDSLVVLVSISEPSFKVSAADLAEEVRVGREFAHRFGVHSARYKTIFDRFKSDRKAVALFGAGHLACSFLSLFKLVEFIDFVIDDNTHKQNMYMPGINLPICKSDRLDSGEIDVCLISFNPLNEAAMIKEKQKFVDLGGEFYSIFSSSNRHLLSLD